MQPSIFLPTIIFVPTVAGRKRWQESKCAEVVRDLYCVMQQHHRTRSLLETRVTETSMALSHGQNEWAWLFDSTGKELDPQQNLASMFVVKSRVRKLITSCVRAVCFVRMFLSVGVDCRLFTDAPTVSQISTNQLSSTHVYTTYRSCLLYTWEGLSCVLNDLDNKLSCINTGHKFPLCR